MKIQHEARSFVRGIGLEDSVVVRSALDHLDVRLCMHVHNKKAPNRKTFHSQTSIAKQFYDDLVKLLGDVVSSVPCPWFVVPIAGEDEDTDKKDKKRKSSRKTRM